ncbi:MAG: response regulator [Gammaproteobacteria bacterium]|nr:MAG: response regulator [Gammaproteobacteria bacterium]
MDMAIQNALVVDDSKLARITLKRLLEKHNLSVSVAGSAEEALELIGQTPPDVVFIDHMMPNMDGFEATQKIKANPATAHIPVIMCTGKEGIENYDEEARAIGASGTLTKPPQVDVLDGLLEMLRASPAEPAAPTPPEATPAMAAHGTPGDDAGSPSDAHQQPVEAAAEPAVSSEIAGLRKEIERLEHELAEALRKLEHLSAPTPAAEPQIDEEALAARAARDVERTLMPLVHSELKALSSQVQSNLDEAISESRADLENQISDLNKMLREQADRPAPEPVAAPTVNIDEDALTDRVLTVAQDTVEAMLAHKLAQVEQAAREQVEQALSEARADLQSETSPSAEAPALDTDALKAEVQQWVSTQLQQEAATIADQFAARITRELDAQQRSGANTPSPEVDPADNEWVRELIADNQRLSQAVNSAKVQAWTVSLIALVLSGVSLAKVLGLLP